ncbi:MAG: AAA family ATPase [Proteobacteria bacterium]|nr:AAA family ATPase [Pseudomonadota bacterium]
MANDARFCGDCGAPLGLRCAGCGHDNLPGKRFCSQCGAAFQDTSGGNRGQPGESLAERRQLSVLFADLVASTALGARLDPEDLRDVITAFHGCVTKEVARFGGFIARYMGDGVLVYFGYPQANEDDAERAAHTGLAVVQAVARLDTVAGPPGTLSVRVGIATGLAVVGDLIGSGASLESAAVGDTPNLAARLQRVAQPGSVVIADTTRNLVGGLFEYRDLGSLSLKGFAAPTQAWEVLRERAIDSRFEALRPSRAPLIDREEERALLERRWQQSLGGEGRVVLLSGEPGIGKSRLIAALEQQLGDASHARLRFFCSPHYQDTALYPVMNHLGRAARFQDDDAPGVKRDKLTRLLGPDTPCDDVLLLADLLSIPGAARESPASLTPRQRKDMTLEAILRNFAGLARRTPVLAVFEDLHWADPTTRELLELHIQAIDRLPMLLVVTTRPELPPPWAADPKVTIVSLSGLHRRYASSLIEKVTGDRALPDDLVQRIIARADGVPLFIEELTKTVLESSPADAAGEQLSPTTAPPVDLVPTSLQASLMARLDRLDSGKDAAQIGSVIGRDFSFEMLATLSDALPTQLEAALDRLVRAGLATARGTPPRATYTFKHALVQDAAYASLLRGRRRGLHLRLAEALAVAGAEPELIAWHFGEAHQPERSLEYYLKAVNRATGRYALGEMVSHLRKAIRQLEQTDDSETKLHRELDLQLALGHALIDHQGSGSEDVRAAFERARELCIQLDDTKRLLVVIDGLVLNHLFTHSASSEMLIYADELLAVARRTGDSMALLWAQRARGSARLLKGMFEDARRDMDHVIGKLEARLDGSELPRMARDPRAATYGNFGICLTALGQPEAGAVASFEGIRHAEAANHTVSLIAGLRRACVRGIMQRDTRGVGELSRRLLALNEEHETFVGTREGAIFHAWVQLQDGWDAALLERAHTALEQLDGGKHWVMLPFFMAAIAEVMGERGDRGGAVALLDRAAELVGLTGERWCEPEIVRLKARFSTRDVEEAVALLQLGLTQARDQGARLWELRIATNLAELWRAAGKAAAARDLLTPIYASFTEGVDSSDLTAARILLGELAQFND